MAENRLSGKLTVILHADVAGSTALVQQDEQLAHERIQDSFQRFSRNIEKYYGLVHELRGDALLAEFERASDAVAAALAFQAEQAYNNSRLTDDLQPTVRVGIALGEVVIADNTVTGAGVVLAQRVEQLADAGGLCITAALHEALPRRMPFDLQDLGEQSLKGFDDPVHVYRVELSPGESIPSPSQEYKPEAPAKSERLKIAIAVILVAVVAGTVYWLLPSDEMEEPASVERMAFPLPDKPSIAVLPFSNLSDDKQQEYFADGMTEDLITDISNVNGLFVIARNSVFTYKGKAVKVRQVAEELGVRYVMEGSVRRVGDQVRINAQLIDATTGGHVWAERYDGSLDDVFSMQDKIIKRIVTALAGTLTGQESGSSQIEISNSEAYDAYLRGWERYRLDTPEDLSKAVFYFEQAIELDPSYARAHSALAAVYWKIAAKGWWNKSLHASVSQAIEQSRVTLVKAMEQPSALTHQVASERAAYFQRKPDKALFEAERAIALDNNDPAGHLAMANALLKANRATEAVESVRTAMRLDPHYPASYVTRLGQAQFAMGQYENAAKTLETAAKRNPNDDWTFVYLAAAYGQLGSDDKAKLAVEKANFLRAKGGWGMLTSQNTRARTIHGAHNHFQWVGDYKPLREGLRKAGVTSEADWHSLKILGPSGPEVKGATTIDAATAKALHDRGVTFIDVYIKGLNYRIPGAFLLEEYTDEFNDARLAAIVDKHQEVVIYSSRAGDVDFVPRSTARAVSWGYEKVYYFRDGLNGWQAAGYPVETGKK